MLLKLHNKYFNLASDTLSMAHILIKRPLFPILYIYQLRKETTKDKKVRTVIYSRTLYVLMKWGRFFLLPEIGIHEK